MGVCVFGGGGSIHVHDMVYVCTGMSLCTYICEVVRVHGRSCASVEGKDVTVAWLPTPVHHPCSQVMELRETCTCWLGPGCLWLTL